MRSDKVSRNFLNENVSKETGAKLIWEVVESREYNYCTVKYDLKS